MDFRCPDQFQAVFTNHHRKVKVSPMKQTHCYPALFHCLAYKDLHDRTETRQAAWEFPGWDECVVRTGEENMSVSLHKS